MHRFATFALVLALSAPGVAQQNMGACAHQAAASAKHQPPKPHATAAPGGGPDKVWVNSSTNVYHCPGDRYYGKTKDGKYMTEKEARAAGAHGVRHETCFK
jgi:hypothetical protein